jgi:branched-chain amino acid transport system permease protein
VVRLSSTQGLREAVPFLLIIALAVARGSMFPGRTSVTAAQSPVSSRPTWSLPSLVGTGVGAMGIVALHGALGYRWQGALIASAIAGLMALSLVVITGFGGQLSLMQLSFAALGGLTIARIGWSSDVGLVAGVVAAMTVAAAAAVVLGIPALRVRGATLAAVTLGAAVSLDNLVFRNASVVGGLGGSRLGVPSLGGFEFGGAEHPTRFFAFATLLLVGGAGAVAGLRCSALGQRILATRDNERASAAAGVHLVRVRLTVFAIAGALAALSGVLLGFQSGTMPYNRLDALSSLFMVAVAFVGGIASVRGALLAGLLAPGGVLSVAVSQLTTRAEIQTLITGALLLVVVIRWPNGLAGLVKPPTRLARPA